MAKQVVQPPPAPVKKVPSVKAIRQQKTKEQPTEEKEEGNQDEEIKAVANLPDFVGNAKAEKEEPYRINKPKIPGLDSAADSEKKSVDDVTSEPVQEEETKKSSDLQDPDAFMRNVLSQLLS